MDILLTLNQGEFMFKKKNKNKNLDGIILGKENGEFVTSEENKHVFVCGSAGSGKSKSFVIPNLLNWKGSAIVFDTTGKLFKETSGYREKHLKQRVFKWNPASKDGFT